MKNDRSVSDSGRQCSNRVVTLTPSVFERPFGQYRFFGLGRGRSPIWLSSWMISDDVITGFYYSVRAQVMGIGQASAGCSCSFTKAYIEVTACQYVLQQADCTKASPEFHLIILMRKLHVSELHLDPNPSRPQYLSRAHPNRDSLRTVLKSLRDRKDFLVRVTTANTTLRIVKPKKVSLGPRLAVEIVDRERVDRYDKCEKSVEKVQRKLRKTSAVPTRRNNYISQPSQPTKRNCDQVLMRNSSRLKLLYSEKRRRFPTVVVLSAEFLMSQNNFWRPEEIDPGAISNYRRLANCATLVWILRKERSLQRLVEFCGKSDLPLDSVYVIECCFKCAIGVDYEALMREVGGSRVMVFDLARLHMNSKLDDYEVFENKLPMCQSGNVMLYLIKTEKNINGGQLLGYVWQLVSGFMTGTRISLQKMLNGYLQYLKHNSNVIQKKKKRPKTLSRGFSKPQMEIDDSISVYDDCEDRTLERMELLKKEWMDDLNKFGANTAVKATGQSLHYIVGDLIKRNFPIFLEFSRMKEENQRRRDWFADSQLIKNRKAMPIILSDSLCYDVPVYVFSI